MGRKKKVKKEPPPRKWKWIRPTKYNVADDDLLEQIINPPPRYPVPEFKGQEYVHGPVVDSEYIFMCPEPNCYAKFTTSTSLTLHSISHRDPRIKCQFCGMTFKTDEEKALHCNEFHPDLDKYPLADPLQCKKCGKSSRSQKALWRHVRESHRDHDYPCQYCGFPFTRPENLKDHLRKMHPLEMGIAPEIFTCTICKKEYRHKNSLRTHIRQIHRGSPEKTWRCVLCNTVYNQKIVYQHHMKRHTNPTYYPCHVCNSKFRNMSHLRRHESGNSHKQKVRKAKFKKGNDDMFPAPFIKGVKTVNPNLTKEELINLCKRTTVKVMCHRVDQEITTRSTARVEKWEKKQKEKARSEKKMGKSSKDTVPTDKYLNCFYCNSNFPDLKTVKVHERLCYMKLRSQKLIMCPVCNKEFDRPFKLRIHSQTHRKDKVRPYKCFYCDSRFTSSYIRSGHVKKSHFDISNPITKYIYKCSYEGCDKHYSNHTGLKEHIESRHNEIRQKCDQCGRTFRTERNLIKHVRHVHAECPTLLHCRACNKLYKDRTTYLAHLKRRRHARKEREYEAREMWKKRRKIRLQNAEASSEVESAEAETCVEEQCVEEAAGVEEQCATNSDSFEESNNKEHEEISKNHEINDDISETHVSLVEAFSLLS